MFPMKTFLQQKDFGWTLSLQLGSISRNFNLIEIFIRPVRSLFTSDDIVKKKKFESYIIAKTEKQYIYEYCC